MPSQQVPAEQFFGVDIRVGRVVACDEFPEARNPAYRMRVDFGPEIGELRSSARVTDHYARAELVGSMVIGVVNLPPRQVGPVRSEALILGAYENGGHTVRLLRPDGECVPGDRIG